MTKIASSILGCAMEFLRSRKFVHRFNGLGVHVPLSPVFLFSRDLCSLLTRSQVKLGKYFSVTIRGVPD